jgi:sugar phosphate permease
VGLAFLCLDVIRYGFMLWAPTYLFEVQHANISQAAWKSIALPVAGVLGAITAGWATDKFFGSRRAPVIAMMLALLGVFAFIFPKIPAQHWVLSMICLLVIGFMTYGPHVLMVGAIAMDFGTRKGAASAAGFIDALGYVGASLAGVLSGYLIDHTGWNAAFYFWVSCAFVGAVLSAILWKYKPAKGRYM